MKEKPPILRDWMDERKITAEDVAQALNVSIQTVANWRSAGVPNRRIPHIERLIAEWDTRPNQIGGVFPIPVSTEQFNRWNAAALAAGKLMSDWAKDGLDDLAAHHQTSAHSHQHPSSPAKKQITYRDLTSGGMGPCWS